MINLINKNNYIMCLCIIWLSACSVSQNPQEQANTVELSSFLVGTYTPNSSQGIYQITLNTDTKVLTNNGLLAKDINPSYLAINSDAHTIYAATGDVSGGISIFSRSEKNAVYETSLQLTGLGKGACHITLSPDNTKVAIATYGSGDVFQFDVNTVTKQLTNKKHFQNTGYSLTKRQKSPHMHFVQWDKTGRFLYSVDLGTDQILVFDRDDKQFIPKVAVTLNPGDGPRHLSMHPTRPQLFVTNELSNSITAFKIDTNTGQLTKKGKLNLLENNPPNTNYASAIKISKDGNYLYVAIRGVDRIAVIDISHHALTQIQSIETGGHWPRDIELSQNQKHMLIANRRSNTITVLNRDTNTGLLTSTDITLQLDSPSYLGAISN